MKVRKQGYGTGAVITAALLLGGGVSGSPAQDPGQNAGGGFSVQQTGRAPGQARVTGSITGTVFFGDTQRPARFANVQVIPVSTDSEGRFRGGGGPSGRTALDGTFLIDNIEVGDYYVTASATGYISPFAEAQVAIGNGAAQDEALRRLPIAHVAQGAPGSASITLDRGAVIAGAVSWDDGSPAAGVQVSTVTVTTQTSQGTGRGFGGFGGPQGRFPGSTSDTTDDRGRFRLTGVAPGEYLVRASVQAPVGTTGNGGRGGFGRTVSLSAFAPGKIRRSEAQSIRVAAADERNDVAITLDLRALHTVSGQVSVASGSAVSGGQVRLVDATDSSLARFAEIASDGSFHVPYVPAGTYTMSVNARVGGSGSPGPGGGTFTPGQNLQPLQQTLAVADGDLSGLNVTLTPAVTAANR